VKNILAALWHMDKYMGSVEASVPRGDTIVDGYGYDKNVGLLSWVDHHYSLAV